MGLVGCCPPASLSYETIKQVSSYLIVPFASSVGFLWLCPAPTIYALCELRPFGHFILLYIPQRTITHTIPAAAAIVNIPVAPDEFQFPACQI